MAAESVGGWHGVAEAQVKKLAAALAKKHRSGGGGGSKAPLGQIEYPAAA